MGGAVAVDSDMFEIRVRVASLIGSCNVYV